MLADGACRDFIGLIESPTTLPLTQIVSFIREWREKNDEFSGIAKALVEHCIGNLAGEPKNVPHLTLGLFSLSGEDTTVHSFCFPPSAIFKAPTILASLSYFSGTSSQTAGPRSMRWQSKDASLCTEVLNFCSLKNDEAASVGSEPAKLSGAHCPTNIHVVHIGRRVDEICADRDQQPVKGQGAHTQKGKSSSECAGDVH